VQLDNARVDPSKVGTVPGVSQVSDLPTPLVVVLALLLVIALAIAALSIRSLVNARRA
jgi:CHASE1-domain containing sensor protein